MLIKNALLPNCYLPPVAWFAIVLNAEKIIIEQHENFVKSTLRNRTEIAGPNGLLKLSVPVVGGKSHRQLFKDVRICYAENWQKNHWMSLCSCYRRSAYFEYYEDKLAPFYHQRFNFLFDFNYQLTATVFKMLKLSPAIGFTTEYQKLPQTCDDYRGSFKDSKSISFYAMKFCPPKYFQCFENNYGFLPNLSILDMLFSMGAQAAEKIRSSLSHS